MIPQDNAHLIWDDRCIKLAIIVSSNKCKCNNWRLCKRAYIGFRADFNFLQDRAKFWQTDLFLTWKASSCNCFGRFCASFSRNEVCKRTQFCMKQHLYEWIFRRRISTWLLAALTALFFFFLNRSLVCVKSRETDQKNFLENKAQINRQLRNNAFHVKTSQSAKN